MSRLLSSLPIGAKVRDKVSLYNGLPLDGIVLDHGHDGPGITSFLSQKIITLKCFDAREESNSDGYRRSFGNNRYKLSNIFQWLNKDAAAGNWYAAQHEADASPTNENVWNNYNEYDQEDGFLSHLSANMKAALQTVNKVTVKHSVDGGGTETVSGKIHLLSTTEVGLANEGGIAEGSVYSYFSGSNNTDARRAAYPTQQAVSKSEYTYQDLATDKWWYYWLRTPYSSNSSNARCVRKDGSLYDNKVYYGNYGVRPAWFLPSSILVSDNPNSEGYYEIQWNATPTISPGNTNYGNVTAPPSITTTITDPDGDAFTYTVKLNGTTKTSGSATGTKTLAIDTAGYWPLMALGTNTITVQATDSQGATTSVTYTMNKTNSAAPVPTTDLVNNTRKETSFYIGFQIGLDADGDSQTVVAQVSDSSDMSNPTEFSGVEKEVAGAWLPVQTLTNADVGARLRIQVTNQTVGDTIYVRLKDTDSGSGSPVYTSTYAIVIGSVLEFDTLPISRTEKPSLVVAYLNKTMPADATLTMYACNNANDGAPTWEAITEGETHQFTNKTKTAQNWAVSVKTSITAGATAGEISVSAVGLGVL